MEKDVIEQIVKNYQPLVDSNEFYFQKGQDALKKWLGLSVAADLQDKIVHLSSDYDQLQQEAEKDPNLKNILELLFEIISYCDLKAKDKIKYNKYEDKRVLAEAAVRMNHWLERLIQFKFAQQQVPKGSILNAFEFLLKPENQTTILSENHRELISKNLLNLDFDSNNFVTQLKSFFSPFNIQVHNPFNYTYLLSCIIYKIQNEWKEEAIGLMASDGTGWQDGYINEMKNFDAAVIWNSKRPSGTTKTLNYLREIIEDGKTFNLYYCSSGVVNYVASIVDFADSQEQLEKNNWPQKYKSILYYHDKFKDYQDDSKQAAIIFLTQSIEKMLPVPVSDFKFYNGYKPPTQDNLSPIKSEPSNPVTTINVSEKKDINKMSQTKNHLNQILFGPPGTGKTFNSINHAIAIVESKNIEQILTEPRKEVKSRFDNYLKEGQIVFTTFHQSMSYEDFIEGIKPIEPKVEGQEVFYKVVDGIFKVISEKAKANNNLTSLPAGESDKIPFETAFDLLKQKIEDSLLDDPVLTPNEMRKGLVFNLANSFFSITGINGSSIRMMTRTGNEQNTMTKPTLKLIFDDLQNIEKYVSGGMKTYYKALVEEMYTWKGDIKNLSQDIKPKNYVIIIDEINRGNISQIFGELITLIEDDKRLGSPEALEVDLPYSKNKFGVPPNLYIIGTMNTADRSVEALDTALRRRFSFKEMLPAPSLIALYGKLKDQHGKVEGIDLVELLETINTRIEKLLDKDHLIGHSYFMNVSSIDDLKFVFQNKILPLLQEYFYGDFGKIGLVLGASFFEDDTLKVNQNRTFFADFPEYETSDLLDRKAYRLKNVNDMDFIMAISRLLLK